MPSETFQGCLLENFLRVSLETTREIISSNFTRCFSWNSLGNAFKDIHSGILPRIIQEFIQRLLKALLQEIKIRNSSIKCWRFLLGIYTGISWGSFRNSIRYSKILPVTFEQFSVERLEKNLKERSKESQEIFLMESQKLFQRVPL